MPSDFDNRTYQLIHNQRFVEWVVNPTEELNEYWEQYILQYPNTKDHIDEARFLIKGLIKKEGELKEDEVSLLWERIYESNHLPRVRTFKLSRWVAAAIIFVILGIGSWLAYTLAFNRSVTIDYSSIANAEQTGNEITLILSDNVTESFDNQDVELIYDEKGSVITGAGKVLEQASKEKKTKEEHFNQLVVPRGKRSNIVLSDGSHLWLNSGSRAIYPVVFNKKYREIYVEGEAYLDVAYNPDLPFIVKTDLLSVKVLGTRFNVSAYPDDNQTSVVLVEGSVQTTANSEKRILEPNDALIIEKESGKISLEKVNVMEYISWKDGWLICNKDDLGSIIPKLSRYYNVKTKVTDSAVSALTLSGKLDLKAEYVDVLKTISTTAPVKYEIVNDTILLSFKNK